VYGSESGALAVLEILVHLQQTWLLDRYLMCRAVLDSTAMEELPQDSLPAGWRAFPAPAPLQDLGHAWIRAELSVALRVPSAIVPFEWNYLVNPRHPGFSALEVLRPEPFRLDTRQSA
jgi:RES domain-containing protein